ncbi:NTP transferase domain-containing protein [bacterium]|nr:NTP transferase domain-containing protein [bacterium]
MNRNFYTVIMAGGVGSRFWPMSTQNRPKQFLDILNTGKSLIRQTFERFSAITPVENILVVTNEAYRDLVKEHLPELDDRQILGEPEGKNTAPCIAYATEKILKRNNKASMVVAPSDHIIRNADVFTNVVTKALHYVADNDRLVTLGIEPTRPDTGYGYIHYDHGADDEFKKVLSFTEKPILQTAKDFLASGEYLWNAGIFVWSAASIKKALSEYLPKMNMIFSDNAHAIDTELEQEAITNIYKICDNISIDYGIMEKARNVEVYPAPFDWSDIGTWNALFDIQEKDENGNVVKGKNLMLRNTHHSLIYLNDEKYVALNGVENLIVVESDKAILIADRNDEQAVKEIVGALKKLNLKEFI